MGTAIVQALVKQLGAVMDTVNGTDGMTISIMRAPFTSRLPKAA